MTGRRAPLAAVVVAVLAVATACTGVPTQGEVVTGPAPAGVRDAEFVRPVVSGPRPGMTAEQVATGFLAANASADDDFAVARMYLDNAAAGEWDPDAGVHVLSADEPQVRQRGAAVVLSATRVAVIDEEGTRQTHDPRTITVRFDLVRRATGWRIAALPDGLLLADADVRRVFQSVNAYFLDPTGELVVPDPRWIVRQGTAALATSAVRVTLTEPSPGLRRAVATAIPAGVDLALGSVPVADGVAQVALTGQLADVPDDDLPAAAAQIAWSLRQVPGVTAMEVTVDGVPVSIPGAVNPGPLDQWSAFDPDVVGSEVPLYGVDARGRLVLVRGGTVTRAADGPPPARTTGVQPDGGLWAMARDPSGAVRLADLTRPGGRGTALPGRTGVRPTVDRRDRVWWLQDGVLRVLAVDRKGVPGPGRRAGVPGVEQVRSFAVARDGVRVALAARIGGRTRVGVGAIAPGPSGPRVAGLIWVPGSPDALAVAWRSAEEVAVLARTGDRTLIRSVDIEGSILGEVPAPQGAVALSTVPGGATVTVSADGSSFLLTGGEPQRIEGARWVSHPG